MGQRPVAVVCVTYNAQDVIDDLLVSLEGEPVSPVVVVDNGSRDGTVDRLLARPDVTLIQQDNRGYAGGVNRGVAATPPTHDVLVLNPDLRLADGAVRRLSWVLERDERAGVVVPRLLDGEGRPVPSLRREPRAWRTFVETVVGGTRAGRAAEAFAAEPAAGTVTADWATGAAMLLRRQMLDEVGLLDERYFLYSEETELCLRARDAGWWTVCATDATARHVGGDMGHNATLWALRAVNRVRLERQRRGSAAAARMRLASLLFEGRRTLTGQEVSRLAVRALTRRDLDGSAETLIRELGGVRS